jgi:hypothetical protein
MRPERYEPNRTESSHLVAQARLKVALSKAGQSISGPAQPHLPRSTTSWKATQRSRRSDDEVLIEWERVGWARRQRDFGPVMSSLLWQGHSSCTTAIRRHWPWLSVALEGYASGHSCIRYLVLQTRLLPTITVMPSPVLVCLIDCAYEGPRSSFSPPYSIRCCFPCPTAERGSDSYLISFRAWREGTSASRNSWRT